MKKIILLFLLVISFYGSANHYLIIDSIVPKNPCLNEWVKVYCHDSSGVFNTGDQLVLRISSAILHTGTYQQLQDSGHVWSFQVTTNLFSSGVKYIYFDSPYGWGDYAITVGNCYYSIQEYYPKMSDEYYYYDLWPYRLRINLRTKGKELVKYQ